MLELVFIGGVYFSRYPPPLNIWAWPVLPQSKDIRFIPRSAIVRACARRGRNIGPRQVLILGAHPMSSWSDQISLTVVGQILPPPHLTALF